MALNRDQEDRIALEAVRALEKAGGRKIPTGDRVRLKQFEGVGHGIAFANGCGELSLEARRMREEGVELRIAITPQAESNGCLKIAQHWLVEFRKDMRQLAASWGRKGLPVKAAVVIVDRDGRAIDRKESEDFATLDRGG